jgi:hypothetical protein
MRKLNLLVHALACAAAMLVPAVHAELVCGTDGAGQRRCRAGLTQAQVQTMQRAQEKQHWCWAATVSMVLTHHGVPWSQQQLVRRQFGRLTDQKVSGAAITGLLSSPGGEEALADVAVGDLFSRRFELDTVAVVRELAAERPLVFGVNGHAMVLVEVEFEQLGSNALRIVAAVVVDPAPGRGVRPLRRSEMRPSYVASIQLKKKPADLLAGIAPAADDGGL